MPLESRPQPLLAAAPARQGSIPPMPKPIKIPRQRSVLTACDHCRRRRIRCTGERPRCSNCHDHDQECVYQARVNESAGQALKRKYSDLQVNVGPYKEIYNSLVHLPRPEALALMDAVRTKATPGEAMRHFRSLDIPPAAKSDPKSPTKKPIEGLHEESKNPAEELLHHLHSASDHASRVALERIRATSTPSEALVAIRGEVMTHRLSEQEAALRILPPLHSLLELELMAQHPVMYPILDPTLDDRLSIGPRRWQSQVNIWGAAGGGAATGTELPPWSEPVTKQGPDVAGQGVVEVSEPKDAEISFWTTVPVTNHTAADTISLYLQTDHPLISLFDPDTFIGSLVDGNFDFCSCFLVNALLAFASLSYTSKDSDAAERSLKFEDEAGRLWQAERSNPPCNATLSGLMFLYLSRVCRGDHERGCVCIEEAVRMAAKLRLFGVKDTVSTREWRELSAAEQTSTAFAAWGTYNTTIQQSIWAVQLATEYPPTIPVPSSPPSMGHTFTTLCGFYVVVSGILLMCRSPTGPRPMSPAFGLSAYERLLAFGDRLTGSMTRNACNTSQVLVVHMHLHGLVLEIFRPFITLETARLSSGWLGSKRSPNEIYNASLKQLRRLVLVYMLFPESARSIFWNSALLYVSNAALEDTADPGWRFYFLVAVQCYQRLGPCYRLAPTLAQGLVALATDGGAIGVGEMHAITSRVLRVQPRFHKSSSSSASTPPQRRFKRGKPGIRINLKRSTQDWDSSLLDYLLDRFDEMGMFDEFTDGIL